MRGRISYGQLLHFPRHKLCPRHHKGWDTVTPPQLTRDTPVLQVTHPRIVGVFPLLRNELDRAVFNRFDGGLDSVSTATNHWSVNSGSITTPERSPRGTFNVCGSIFQKIERLEVDDIFSRASNRSIPRYVSGTTSLSFASFVKMLIIGRP